MFADSLVDCSNWLAAKVVKAAKRTADAQATTRTKPSENETAKARYAFRSTFVQRRGGTTSGRLRRIKCR